MKKTGPTNVHLKNLIESLRNKSFETNSSFLLTIAKKLKKPRRRKIKVNLSDIERNTEKNDTVIVPGIVLAAGELTKPINIAAWKFSAKAEEKIKNSKGKCLTIDELIKKNPKGKGVKIIS